MSLVVKKFGGTSVANLERIEFVADQIFKFHQQKQQVVVVVSAMKGETDALENLAYKISAEPDLREMAALLATGEQIVISLLAIALIKRGCSARSYTGLQLGIETNGIATNARISNINIQNIQKDLQAGRVVVVAGFQGVDLRDAHITTLGRGGSDTTAVALAIALNAKRCDIYTDVDGVYTADPNLAPAAKKLDSISFNEMLELSGLGAKVMQIRAVELGSYFNMPIKVLSSFNVEEQAGTLICNNPNQPNHTVTDLDYKQVVKFAILKGQVKICINNMDFIKLDLLLNNFADLQIGIDLLHNTKSFDDCTMRVSFVISSKDLERCKLILAAININGSDLRYFDVAKLSIVGLGLASNPNIIKDIHNSLILAHIEPQQVVTSEIKVSVLLNEKDLEMAISILHEKFFSSVEFNSLKCL